MSDRLLVTISVRSDIDCAFVNAGDVFQGIQIWTTRSKIVNDHIKSLQGCCSLCGVVNALYTPPWAIIDKPYDVYTSNEASQSMFESVLNRSDVSRGIAHAALLAKLKDDIYLLFYTEFDQDQQPRVRCLLLDLSRLKIDEVLKRRNDVEGTCFIDEPTKEDLMDSLLQQRLDNFNSLSARRQVQLTVEKQQMKLQAIRHKFRMLITDEVKQRMWDKPKKVQSEVADMCLKGMNFRFKGIHSMTKAEETDVKLWLSSFLDLLGVKAN